MMAKLQSGKMLNVQKLSFNHFAIVLKLKKHTQNYADQTHVNY